MKTSIYACLICFFTLTACKKEPIRPNKPFDILSMAYGKSNNGTVEHFRIDPYHNAKFGSVFVEISKGNKDSSITMLVFFDDTLARKHENIPLDSNLSFSESYGPTPYDGFLTIDIDPLKILDYFYALPCGNDCVAGNRFSITFD